MNSNTFEVISRDNGVETNVTRDYLSKSNKNQVDLGIVSDAGVEKYEQLSSTEKSRLYMRTRDASGKSVRVIKLGKAVANSKRVKLVGCHAGVQTTKQYVKFDNELKMLDREAKRDLDKYNLNQKSTNPEWYVDLQNTKTYGDHGQTSAIVPQLPFESSRCSDMITIISKLTHKLLNFHTTEHGSTLSYMDYKLEALDSGENDRSKMDYMQQEIFATMDLLNTLYRKTKS